MIVSLKNAQRGIRLPGVTLSVPVMQATIGECDSVALAAAVSRAGGLGTLCVRIPSLKTLAGRLRKVRYLTPRPVLLAFTASWEEDAVLDTAMENGFRLVQVFWWNGPRLAPRIQRGGGTVFWQVGTVSEAEEAIQSGASVLIAQGNEAGGQVRSPYPVLCLVRELRETFGTSVPIIAGGGFADRRDTQAALQAGADAAFFGTRFLLSEESNAAPRDKSRLLRAVSHQLRLENRMTGDWPCSPRRELPTASGVDNPGLYAGQGIDRIYALRPAGEITRALAP